MLADYWADNVAFALSLLYAKKGQAKTDACAEGPSETKGWGQFTNAREKWSGCSLLRNVVKDETEKNLPRGLSGIV